MVTVAQIRTKLQDKIFTPYGKTVTLRHANGHTFNGRGDMTVAAWTSSSVTLVPYDLSSGMLSWEEFSAYNTGEFFAAVPHSVTVSVQDQVVMDGVTWEVKEVLDHLLPTNAVIIIRLTKMTA